jgi:hypothetical protein
MNVRKWLCIGTIGVSSAVFAVPVDSSRYQKIAERNMFGLRETPEIAQPAKTEVAPALPKIFLTGITTLGGYKRALLAVQYPAKPGQPAKEDYLMLTEGQREESIEVLSVDENARVVRVNNSGTEMSLNFENNGVKAMSTAANAGPNQPNQPGVATPGSVFPSANPSTPGMTPPQAGFRRTLRLPNSVPAPTTPVTPPRSSAALGTPGVIAQRQATNTATPISAEEELLLRALQENGGQVAPQ